MHRQNLEMGPTEVYRGVEDVLDFIDEGEFGRHGTSDIMGTWKSKHSQTGNQGNSHQRTNVLLTIIMSNERPSDHNRIGRIAGSFKGKLSSLLHLSRAPTPSSIDKDSSSDNGTK
jgi:hypothetical protein